MDLIRVSTPIPRTERLPGTVVRGLNAAFLVVVALLLAVGIGCNPAHADQSRLSNTSGAKLMRICAPNYGPANYSSDFARNTVDIRVCEAYITGIYDTVSQMQQSGGNAVICVPDAANARPIRFQLVQWLAQHPEDGAKQASAVVLHVLQLAYPCNGQPSPDMASGRFVTKMPGGMDVPPLMSQQPMLKLPPMPTPGERLPTAQSGQQNAQHNPQSTSAPSSVPSVPPADIISIPDSP